jgi:hypothetical protein
MLLEFKNNKLVVTREESDPKYYGNYNAAGESRLLYAIKTELNKQGFNLIKKRMWKDGHMVDDCQQYLRPKNNKITSEKNIAIYWNNFAIEGANDAFNRGSVELSIESNYFG